MRNLSRTHLFWFIVVLVVLALFILPPTGGRKGEPMPFSDFVQKVEEGKVDQVTFKGQQITGVLADGTSFKTTGPEFLEPVYHTLVEHGVTPNFEEQDDDSLWLTGLFTFLPLLVIVLLFLWFMRNLQGSNGRAMSFGKSRARLQTDGTTRITFEDVAGIDESKEELSEIIDFLKDPRKFTRLGGRIPKGVLLMGSPGTGKTLLARAVAGEAGVPFFSISGSDFVEMFVGVGASRVRDLFDQGKKSAPCIIFIDEIDAVGRHRGAGLGGGHDEREQTLNQLLVEMDGFEGTEGVIIVAATNRPDVLDPALLRPGRFDRRVVVPSPDMRGREKILEIHSRRIPLGDHVDLSVIAKGTPGFSGADLENLCNEAALLAARKDKTIVEQPDFEEAREKVYLGPERRSMILPESERMTTAYHEAGHALIAHLLPGHDPVHKITIVPRGRALGLTWTLPDEDRLSMTKEAMLKQIAMLMGGRVAEEVALQNITGGAANDIEKATKMARYMVCELGMSDELGPVSWGEPNGEPFLGRQMAQPRSYSEETARRIDTEVRSIVSNAYQSAKKILVANVHILHKVAQDLMDRETLDREEFSRLVEQAGPVVPEGLAWMGA
jgi:cell division protease FtsH